MKSSCWEQCVTTRSQDVEIDGLGAQGDGIVEAPSGQRLYVPFALPSERWRIREGERDTLLRAHPLRATPVCPNCGRPCAHGVITGTGYPRASRGLAATAGGSGTSGCVTR